MVSESAGGAANTVALMQAIAEARMVRDMILYSLPAQPASKGEIRLFVKRMEPVNLFACWACYFEVKGCLSEPLKSWQFRRWRIRLMIKRTEASELLG